MESQFNNTDIRTSLLSQAVCQKWPKAETRMSMQSPFRHIAALALSDQPGQCFLTSFFHWGPFGEPMKSQALLRPTRGKSDE